LQRGGDVALLVTFNQAIDGVLKNNQKARQNPKALAQRDGFKRGLMNSLTGNLRRFGRKSPKWRVFRKSSRKCGKAKGETKNNG
jgi:hypothetical protein